MGSRITTNIGSGSGDGVTGDVDVDVGLLPIPERHLNSGGEDCSQCTSRPKIEVSGTDFQDLVKNCYDGDCPEDVPIGCWDTSAVTDMAFAFSGVYSDDSINCWNTARVTDMNNMFYYVYNFNQPLNDWNVENVKNMSGCFTKQLISINHSMIGMWHV